MNLAYWMNSTWMWKCRAAGHAFAGMTRRVASAQAEVLRSILHRNQDTHFGTRQRFSREPNTLRLPVAACAPASRMQPSSP